MRANPRRRLIGAAIALVLAIALLAVARPAAVWGLLRATDLGGLLAAAGMAAAALVCRGVRVLLLLPPGRLRLPTAALVAATAHAATVFVPARLGELALPLLLRRTPGCDLAAGVSTLLAARAVDIATLGIGAGAAVLAGWGLTEPFALIAALVLLVPPLLLPKTLAAADWVALRTVAPRGLSGRRWTRRIRRVRRAVSDLGRSPGRLLGAATASLGMWLSLWGMTWFLLVAMGYRWPPAKVVAGSAVATLTNLLPFNLVGNIGVMEAGWTAAFVGLGIPLETAAATGYACHVWSLAFAAVYGAIAWGMLVVAWRGRQVEE
jgi:uncharacterized membrane protein YbhN (UPF0104 family)